MDNVNVLLRARAITLYNHESGGVTGGSQVQNRRIFVTYGVGPESSSVDADI